MKQHIPDWHVMLDGLRGIGEVSELEAPFYEPFNKSKKLLE
jgi:hypothetical protein